MNTQDIRNFIVVTECGSFSKAARKLFMTPQGLSKSIKGLENELGVILLNRNTKGIQLTEKGKLFLDQAKEVYSSLEKLEHIFDREIDSTKGRITISSSLGILASLTPEYLLSFNNFFPNVEIGIKEKNDIKVDEDVRNDAADMGLAKKPVDKKIFNVYPIEKKRHCALVYKGHPLFERDVISINDLHGEKIIIENSDFKVYSKFRELCRQYDFEPEIYFETTEISMAHYLAHLKKGIAITVESEEDRIAFEDLKMVFFEEDFFCEWCVITKKEITPITREFLKYLGYKPQ